MDEKAIVQELDFIADRLEDKGFTEVNVTCTLNIRDSNHYVSVNCTDPVIDERLYKSFWKCDCADALVEAHTYVREQRTETERRQSAFAVQLAKLIDTGRALGIETEFLNPLTAMAEKLASNALEAPKPARNYGSSLGGKHDHYDEIPF